MNDGITRYPLCWPAGRPRTPGYKRERSKFHKQTRRPSAHLEGHTVIERERVDLGAARDELLAELARLGARDVILSTDLRLRGDGLPYASQRQPDDPGAAVYFRHKGREFAFACDRWTRIEDNIVSIAKTIEALRGIERWGTGEMVEAAFTGFTALPAAQVAIRRWWEVLGVAAHFSTEEVQAAYRRLVMEHHPDRNGGDDRAMKEINHAYEQFKRERGL